MKLIIFSIVFILMSPLAFSTEVTNEKVVYKYREYEKFDFDTIDVDAGLGNKGALSVFSRYTNKFKNKLPFRTNFKREIWRSVERSR